MRNTFMRFVLLFFLLNSIWIVSASSADNLPVIEPELAIVPYSVFQNVITSEQMNNMVDGNEEGLTLDLLNPDLSGKIYFSQYPFEAGDSGYDYTYYTDKIGSLSQGSGILPIFNLYRTKYDANDWLGRGISTATPTAAYRLKLFQAGKGYAGLYGSRVSFNYEDGAFRKMPTIVLGPYVTMVSSDDPESMVIVWETDEPSFGQVSFGSLVYKEEKGAITKHSVKISGLTPNAEYEYYVESVSPDGRKVTSNTYTTHTAPQKGQGPVTFAYGSDSYHGVGGGERAYMGVNAYILNQISANARRQGADFLIFGGDLVEGYSSDKENFAFQLRTWKQVMGGFWRTSPVYPGMGNHEFVWNYYEDDSVLAKWPYNTDSGEAVFASEFYNPTNGPAVSDSRRPTYQENVYHFQYGPVLVISFNNTYWASGFTDSVYETYGGNPLGYIMEDQLAWIEERLNTAENDPSVKFIFLFGHAPVFPYMSHIGDGMWYRGDNKMRPYTKNETSGKLEPEALGIVQVRDRFWKAIAQSAKVAAVLTSHEHGYHRTLISNTTPVGVFPDDDTDGDGKLDKYSPNPEFVNPTWHIMCGGGGSPYNAEGVEPTPWKPERTTSHYGYVLINAEDDKVSMEFVGGPVFEVLDRVDDLMAVKK